MKKVVISLVMTVALCVTGFAQNSNREILAALANSKDVEHVSVGSMDMFFVKLFGGMKEIPGLQGIKSVEIFTVGEKCPKHRKAEIKQQIARLSDDAEYATLMLVKDKSDKVLMFVRQEKDTVKELLLAVVSNDNNDDDATVVHIKGSMKLSDLQKMVENAEKKAKK